MSRDFPDRVNPWKVAEGRKSFRGTIPLARMRRLHPLLETAADDAVGVARFEARFDLDRVSSDRARPLVTLEVSADLPLLCQRSLEPFVLPVRREATLVVVEDTAEQQALPDDVDVTLADNGFVSFRDLVEDELLLGMPAWPVNPEHAPRSWTSGPEEAEAGRDEEGEERRRPFAGLKKMMGGDR